MEGFGISPATCSLSLSLSLLLSLALPCSLSFSITHYPPHFLIFSLHLFSPLATLSTLPRSISFYYATSSLSIILALPHPFLLLLLLLSRSASLSRAFTHTDSLPLLTHRSFRSPCVRMSSCWLKLGIAETLCCRRAECELCAVILQQLMQSRFTQFGVYCAR